MFTHKIIQGQLVIKNLQIGRMNRQTQCLKQERWVMSKERELLRKISRKTHCINYDEIEELLAKPQLWSDLNRQQVYEKGWRAGYEEQLLTQPEQTEQEPVAWKVIDKTNGEFIFVRVKPNARSCTYDDVIPLYTSPPTREPLSCHVINILKERCISESHKSLEDNIVSFVRVIEKAHGIGVDDEQR